MKNTIYILISLVIIFGNFLAHGKSDPLIEKYLKQEKKSESDSSNKSKLFRSFTGANQDEIEAIEKEERDDVPIINFTYQKYKPQNLKINVDNQIINYNEGMGAGYPMVLIGIENDITHFWGDYIWEIQGGYSRLESEASNVKAQKVKMALHHFPLSGFLGYNGRWQDKQLLYPYFRLGISYLFYRQIAVPDDYDSNGKSMGATLRFGTRFDFSKLGLKILQLYAEWFYTKDIDDKNFDQTQSGLALGISIDFNSI